MMTMQYIMAGGHDSLSLCRAERNSFKCFQKGGLMGLGCRQSEMCKVQMLLWKHWGSEKASPPPPLANLRAFVFVWTRHTCKPCQETGVGDGGAGLVSTSAVVPPWPHWDSLHAPGRPRTRALSPDPESRYLRCCTGRGKKKKVLLLHSLWPKSFCCCSRSHSSH